MYAEILGTSEEKGILFITQQSAHTKSTADFDAPHYNILVRFDVEELMVVVQLFLAEYESRVGEETEPVFIGLLIRFCINLPLGSTRRISAANWVG